MLWGSNAREAHPIFFHHVLKADEQRRAADRRRPPAHAVGAVGRPLARARRRHRHPARERGRARDHRRRVSPTWSSSSGRPSGFEAYRESVEPWTLDEAERVTGVPADAIRELAHAYGRRDERAALLDARDHRAPQRGRQRVRADQPRAAHGQGRQVGLGPAAAARPEQRAGRGRHGRDPEQAARVPGRSSTTRVRAKFEAGLGRFHPRGARAAPDRDVRGDGARRAARASTSSARTRRRERRTSSARSGCSTGLDHLVVQDIFLTRDGASSPTSSSPRRRRWARPRAP